MAKRTVSSGISLKRTFFGNLSPGLIFYTVIFIALLILYVLLAYLPDPDKAVLSHYNLSRSGYYWLVSTFVFLVVLISAAGLYGSLMVKSYADLIKGSRDGKALKWLGGGLLILSISLPLTSDLSSIVGLLVKRHSSWQPTLTIIDNYIALILAIASFLLIAKGSEYLYELFRKRIRPLPQKYWVSLFIIISALYSYLVTIEPVNSPLARRAYFLPGWLLIVSIAIPYLYVWYRGSSAAYNIALYQKNIKGYIYRAALKYLAAGITMVIISSIITRILVTTSPALSGLSLTPILFIIYGLLIIDASGYVLIAIGAKKLRQIEEV